jgi:oligopeptide transport system permease protein
VALAFIILIILLTILYSLGIKLSPYEFNAINVETILQAPSMQHWFGTDALGRDLFIRVIHGANMSLFIAVLTAINAFIIGVSLGLIAGYKEGWIEEVIIKFIDFIYSLPDLLVLSIIALFLSQSTTGIVLGLAFINWMDTARVTRAEIKRLKSEEYIAAAKVLGADSFHIIFRHMFPNIMASVLVALSFTIPRAILSESTLSFIGLGISPPDTSWGTLAGDAWQYLRTDPHLIFFPALMIFLTVLSFNNFAEWLRAKLSLRVT